MSMITKAVDEVLRRLCRENFTPDQLKMIENTLYLTLNKYEVSEKSTALQTVNDGWQMHLNYFLDRKTIAGKASGTVELYRYHLSRMLTAINKDVTEITEIDLVAYLEAYRQSRKVGNNYLDSIRMCMRNFFGFLCQKEFIKKNPADGLDKIKSPKEIKKAFSDVELEKLRRGCDILRNKAIIEFLYSTGVRISELCSLNRDDIDFMHEEVIVMGKGSKERTVYLSKVSIMYLQEYLKSRDDDNPALFVSERKPVRRVTVDGMQAMLKRLGEATGVDDVHPHRFRRTLATNLLKKGMPIEEVQVILGHEKIETTLIYASAAKEKVKSDHKKYTAA